jgi:hypothetical protein
VPAKYSVESEFAQIATISSAQFYFDLNALDLALDSVSDRRHLKRVQHRQAHDHVPESSLLVSFNVNPLAARRSPRRVNSEREVI